MRPHVAIASLAGLTAAYPTFPTVPMGHYNTNTSIPPQVLGTWVAPTPSDSRSPCPMLNTLANHGYLPHDGRNISVADFSTAITSGINFASSVGNMLAGAAAKALGKERIDLVDLDAHGVVEHRMSLTRDDASTGNSLTLDPARLQALLDDSTTDYLDMQSLAKSRVRVQQISGPPELNESQTTQAFGESSLLLLCMFVGTVPENGDYSSIQVPKDRMKTFLAEERLPVEHGWAPASRQLTFEGDVSGLSTAIASEYKKLVRSGVNSEGVAQSQESGHGLSEPGPCGEDIREGAWEFTHAPQRILSFFQCLGAGTTH